MAAGNFFREIELPEQKSFVDGVLFPAVLSPTTTNTNITAFEEAIRAEKPWLESVLQESGVILFRGFPVSSPSDFNAVVEAFGFQEAHYVGGRAPRTKVVGRIYTANESPLDKRIPFHHEMNYVPDFPTKLFFFCEEEPIRKGGETPIVLSNIIYEKMKEKQPDFVAKLEEYGVKYTTVAGDEDHPSDIAGRGWKSIYMTHDKRVAEERMAVTSQEPNYLTDGYPLLIENHENQHLIDVERENIDASSSSTSPSSSLSSPSSVLSNNSSTHGLSQNRQLSITHTSPSDTSSGSNASGPRQRWSPFNTLLWISIELAFTSGQIIAAIVVLFISQNENPQNPLYAWVVGYAGGCAASLPLLYWRYLHRNQATGQRSTQAQQQPHHERITSPEPNSYITISFAPSPEDENHPSTSSNIWTGPNVSGSEVRLKMLVDHFKMALDCFFAVWFVVGNVWIFGDRSSSAGAPNLYRLCIVFLAISCMGYAMPFILCGIICCCLPCIVSILGIHEDMNQIRGATEDSINALATHKFKLNMTTDKEHDDSGGLLAAGTQNQRVISGEDAVCCICLAKYTDDDLLRELPCTHFFHTECVDRWLKINASCPLCKLEIG